MYGVKSVFNLPLCRPPVEDGSWIMKADQIPSSHLTTCTVRIPYGIGPEILRAVIDTWQAANDRPVLVSTHPVADSNPPEPPAMGNLDASPAQPGGSWATVQCRRPTDLFRLGRHFERALRKRVFEEPPSASEQPERTSPLGY